jgi:hypothetical protein
MNKSQSKISDRFVAMLVIAFGIYLLAVLLLPIGNGPHHPAKKAECMLQESDLKTAIENYQIAYTKFPTGNHSEIIKCLLGDNPQKVQFININSHDLSTNGEYLDPWKIPYNISFSSTNSFVISSAGPDKKFGDADDIIFNSISNDFVKP